MKAISRFFSVSLFLYSFSFPLMSQVPNSFTYQAVVRNSSGMPLVNQEISLRISILKGDVFGTFVYVETHIANTNQFGLITKNIGEGDVVNGIFEEIDWSHGPFFLKVEIDISGGTNYSEMGTSQLLSVPYALYAKESENGFSGDYNDLVNKPDFFNWDNNILDDFSGNYNDLNNKPSISLINDANISSSALWSSFKISNELSNKLNQSDAYTKTNLQTSGQGSVHYNNITNKPSNLDENKTDDIIITGNQTIDGVKTFSNTTVFSNGINTSNKNIVNVAYPVNLNDAANKAYVDALETRIENLENLINSLGLTVKDIDENFYKIVTIGNQIWMAEDLRTTKYNDGNSIPKVTDNDEWLSLNSPAYCWYMNNEAAYKHPYGALYNWYAVNTNKLCPLTWHVASDADWKQLEMVLGMSQVEADNDGWRGTDQGTQLKNTTGWNNNGNGTNLSGFTAVPGGLRDWDDGTFYWVGLYVHWWTGTEAGSSEAWDRDLYYGNDGIFRYYNNKKYGMSVRCVKD